MSLAVVRDSELPEAYTSLLLRVSKGGMVISSVDGLATLASDVPDHEKCSDPWNPAAPRRTKDRRCSAAALFVNSPNLNEASLMNKPLMKESRRGDQP